LVPTTTRRGSGRKIYPRASPPLPLSARLGPRPSSPPSPPTSRGRRCPSPMHHVCKMKRRRLAKRHPRGCITNRPLIRRDHAALSHSPRPSSAAKAGRRLDGGAGRRRRGKSCARLRAVVRSHEVSPRRRRRRRRPPPTDVLAPRAPPHPKAAISCVRGCLAGPWWCPRAGACHPAGVQSVASLASASVFMAALGRAVRPPDWPPHLSHAKTTGSRHRTFCQRHPRLVLPSTSCEVGRAWRAWPCSLRHAICDVQRRRPPEAHHPPQ